MNIYVGNLPYQISSKELRELFAQYGEVEIASIIEDKRTGISRGYGFVEMPDPSEAQVAIDALNGSDLGGRVLKVSEARPRETSYAR